MAERDVYGLFVVKLDKVTSRDQYVVAYGNIRNVKLYKEQFNLKGNVREYKTKKWLVKRLESLKGFYKEDIKLLYVE